MVALLFCLVAAIITGLFGYRKQMTTMTYIAKLFFFIFLFSFLLLLVLNALSTAPPRSQEPMPAAFKKDGLAATIAHLALHTISRFKTLPH